MRRASEERAAFALCEAKRKHAERELRPLERGPFPVRRFSKKNAPSFFDKKGGASLRSGFYSVRSAVTGSFFAALRDGIRPPISVRITLRMTRITAPCAGRIAFTSGVPVR